MTVNCVATTGRDGTKFSRSYSEWMGANFLNFTSKYNVTGQNSSWDAFTGMKLYYCDMLSWDTMFWTSNCYYMLTSVA